VPLREDVRQIRLPGLDRSGARAAAREAPWNAAAAVVMVRRNKIAGWTADAIAAGALAIALAISGCAGGSSAAPAASPNPVTYTVQSGDTAYRIATRFGVSVGRLLSANGITDPHEIRAGQTLVIPGAYQSGPIARAEGSSVSPYHGVRESRQFDWPVRNGVVSSGYGMRGGAMHDGVDIAAPSGTPIHAADRGVVIFSGRLHGYGNTIIIRHDSHYATVYGHEYVNLVQEGDQVARGQTIGEIGDSGRATGDHLHFEVRRDNVARNPLAFLPPPEPPTAITFAAGGGS